MKVGSAFINSTELNQANNTSSDILANREKSSGDVHSQQI